jgi:hypothetical protein
MAAVTLAYEAFYYDRATPTQIHWVIMAETIRAELRHVRDMTDAANRHKLRELARKMTRTYMADGDDEDLDEIIIKSYSPDTAENCAPLLALVERLVTEGHNMWRDLDMAKVHWILDHEK